MKRNRLKVINVHFDTTYEERRIFEILEEIGIPVSEKLKSGTCFRPWPESTHLVHIELDRKVVDYCPRPFICAAMISSGARLFSMEEFERIAELDFHVDPRYPVFHVPHDGNTFPYPLLTDICVPESIFKDYHAKMRDTDVRKMIPMPYCGQMRQTFELSRLLCDVERFIGPEEIMERYGMGFYYEKAYDGTIIKHATESGRALAMEYYQKHHEHMDWLCQRHPRMILFDMHSFSDEIVQKDFMDECHPTPDVCIGVDEKYTPPELVKIVERRFGNAGFTTEINYPYSGTFIPNAVWSGKSTCDCISIMIEMNKRAYLDLQWNVIPEKVKDIQTVIKRIMPDVLTL